MTCWAMCGNASKTGRPTTTTPRWPKSALIPKGLRPDAVAVEVEVVLVEAAGVDPVVLLVEQAVLVEQVAVRPREMAHPEVTMLREGS